MQDARLGIVEIWLECPFHIVNSCLIYEGREVEYPGSIKYVIVSAHTVSGNVSEFIRNGREKTFEM